MLQFSGTYFNGVLTTKEPIPTPTPLKVVVTVVEQDTSTSNRDVVKLNFLKSRELLADVKDSLSKDLEDERRSYL